MRQAIPLLAVLFATCGPRVAWAGMPAIGFSELARMRLETISFFLMGLLLSAVVVQRLWNWLRIDFTRLPRLTYGRACGVVALWGLLFVIVLAMISGARELMTPGAWKKEWLTYKLRDEPTVASPDDAELFSARRSKLAALGKALRDYADRNDGRYPANSAEPSLPSTLWQLPDVTEIRYVYVPGLARSDAEAPLAFEPAVYRGDPLVLLAGGEIKSMPAAEIVSLRRKETR